MRSFLINRRLAQVASRRCFSTSSAQLRKNIDSPDLYLSPQDWKNLPAKKIFELYQQRVLKLGRDYTKDKHELAALLSTSQETGVSRSEIQQIYDSSNEDLAAGKLGRFNPLEEGEFQTYQYDEYSSSAQDLVEQHRTSREYYRIAAYELPLLAKYRTEFVPPKEKPLAVRYTTYIGENHPAEKKVQIKANFDEFTKNLKLSDAEKHKLKLLLGKRYNPIENEIHVSLERFKYPTQNFKYLLVVLENLIKEAKATRKGELDYSDLPLDTRYYKRKMEAKLKKEKIDAYPKEWLRPQDAPVKKNSVEGAILSQLSEKVKGETPSL